MTGSEYIAQFLISKEIDTVFELQGGMITRIIDALHKTGSIKVISMHHEQAAAFAADAYARVTGKPGVALATSGPGATNLITGIGNCYFDSVPAIFITGQVNLNEQKGEKPIRQLGFQETDIVPMVRPITKGAFAVKSAKDLPQILEEAYTLSMEGRQGPVLVDIPMNIQREEIEAFTTKAPSQKQDENNIAIESYCQNLLKGLRTSKRPLILAGRGVRASHSASEVIKLAEKLNIPVVSSMLGIDIMPHGHPLKVGMIGTYGNRWANYALGECDVLLVLGSRLDLRQTGADIKSFQSNKIIYHIDIAKCEINNRFEGCIGIQSDLQKFLSVFLQQELTQLQTEEWIKEIEAQKVKKNDTEELKHIEGINPNKFIHSLSQSCEDIVAFTTDVGNNQMWAAQSIEVKKGQLFISSGGMGSMGYALPAGIGAAIALKGKPVVVIAGDGGFQINIQELQTIKRNNLPIKIVILNNNCLGMIRQFQDSYFDSKYYSTVWGYDAPDFVAISKAYGIGATKIEKEDEMKKELQKMWQNPLEPFLIEVMIDVHTNVYPKMMFGKPITDMEPKIE